MAHISNDLSNYVYRGEDRLKLIKIRDLSSKLSLAVLIVSLSSIGLIIAGFQTHSLALHMKAVTIMGTGMLTSGACLVASVIFNRMLSNQVIQPEQFELKCLSESDHTAR